VRDLPKETLFVISRNFGYGWIRAYVLLAEVVTLLGPVSFKLSNDRFAFIYECYGVFSYLFAECLLNVKPSLSQLPL
jgi:hypothetical protein